MNTHTEKHYVHEADNNCPVQWHSGWTRAKEHIPHILTCHKTVFLTKNFLPKIQNLALRIPMLEKFSGKTKLLSTHISPLLEICSCQSKNCNFVSSPYFLNPWCLLVRSYRHAASCNL